MDFSKNKRVKKSVSFPFLYWQYFPAVPLSPGKIEYMEERDGDLSIYQQTVPPV